MSEESPSVLTVTVSCILSMVVHYAYLRNSVHVATLINERVELDTQQFGHRSIWKPWNQTIVEAYKCGYKWRKGRHNHSNNYKRSLQ